MGAQLALQTLGAAYAVNSPPRYHDDDRGDKLLRPENQVAYSAAPDAAATRDALITAGIMQPA